MWRVFSSLFAEAFPGRRVLPARIPVIALISADHDRRVLSGLAGKESWDVRFAESSDEASAMASRLSAPVVLFDRDWPATPWKSVMETLRSSPQKPCVILLSGVVDEYLWQEVIRRGGYDVLAKPLRAEQVIRVVKLALSYFNSAPKAAVSGRSK